MYSMNEENKVGIMTITDKEYDALCDYLKMMQETKNTKCVYGGFPGQWVKVEIFLTDKDISLLPEAVYFKLMPSRISKQAIISYEIMDRGVHLEYYVGKTNPGFWGKLFGKKPETIIRRINLYFFQNGPIEKRES